MNAVSAYYSVFIIVLKSFNESFYRSRGVFIMIFQNNNFKVLQSSLDALWIKQKVISNNIANYETPGFKASRVNFNDVLKTKIENGIQVEKNVLEVEIIQDKSLSSRLDGNNVDIEKEQLEMWETYAQYTYLSQNIAKELKNMSYVINNTGK